MKKAPTAKVPRKALVLYPDPNTRAVIESLGNALDLSWSSVAELLLRRGIFSLKEEQSDRAKEQGP